MTNQTHGWEAITPNTHEIPIEIFKLEQCQKEIDGIWENAERNDGLTEDEYDDLEAIYVEIGWLNWRLKMKNQGKDPDDLMACAYDAMEDNEVCEEATDGIQ